MILGVVACIAFAGPAANAKIQEHGHQDEHGDQLSNGGGSGIHCHGTMLSRAARPMTGVPGRQQRRYPGLPPQLQCAPAAAGRGLPVQVIQPSSNGPETNPPWSAGFSLSPRTSIPTRHTGCRRSGLYRIGPRERSCELLLGARRIGLTCRRRNSAARRPARALDLLKKLEPDIKQGGASFVCDRRFHSGMVRPSSHAGQNAPRWLRNGCHGDVLP